MSEPICPPWVDQFVGIPFEPRGRTPDGCDCYGLVRLVLHDVFQIIVPSYEDDYPEDLDRKTVCDLICENKGGWEEIEEPVVGDLVLIKIQGALYHMGIIASSNRWMLHTMKGKDSALESIDGPQWRNKGKGFYRYPTRK